MITIPAAVWSHLGMFAAGAALATVITGWRHDAEVNALKLEQANATIEAADVAERKRKALEYRIATADTAAQGEIGSAQNQIDQLNRCITAGAGCGLRVKVKYQPGQCVPGAAVAGVGDRGEQTAELDDVSRQDYSALRLGIVRVEQALKVCVDATQ